MDTNGKLNRIRKFKNEFFKGLKKRWILTYFPVILVILIIASSLAIFVTYSSSYSDIQTNTKHTNDYYIDLYYRDNKDSTDIKDFAKWVIKDFNSRKNQYMELQIIDKEGNIVVNSSGILIKEKVTDPEFRESIKGHQTYKKTKDQNGQSIMILNYPIKISNGETQGVMIYIVPVEDINQKVYRIAVLIIAICILVILIIVVITIYFNRSIVKPINEINELAKKMAEGQFSERIETKYEDEIGELAETINYLAEQILKSNSIKNEFISSVTHELRTPMTSIKGWGETILDGNFEDKEESELGLRIIIKETSRLEKLVEELLDFSKMESGKLVLYLEEINLAEELEEIVKIMEKMGEIEGVELVYEKKEGIPNILADTDRLKQVFINVINNAIKFTSREKKVTIDIRTSEEDDYIYVDISDEGIGIPESDIEFVKEKFYKGKSKKSGSGLGLAISHEIMQLHKGDIEIKSEEGKGTTVTLIFPKIKEN